MNLRLVLTLTSHLSAILAFSVPPQTAPPPPTTTTRPSTTTTTTRPSTSSLLLAPLLHDDDDDPNENVHHENAHSHRNPSARTTTRRRILSAGWAASGASLLLTTAAAAAATSAAAFATEETTTSSSSSSSSFASIAARANQISKDMDKDATVHALASRKSNMTAYDFTLPLAGQAVPFAELIHQEQQQQQQQQQNANGGIKVKAILVVNIKQDDPVARKTIPELITLATKYGRGADGALAVIACPTDQGYYEPDTSQLIRLKLASEYGYGINPATIVTDKVNLLGSGAHPFWRWLESTCRTPSGLGRVQGNFEKFLVDGRTGWPVRRYPRKYAPANIADDIAAVIAGKPLAPARANYLEEWRQAETDAERDTYRFEKGLNYFDQ